MTTYDRTADKALEAQVQDALLDWLFGGKPIERLYEAQLKRAGFRAVLKQAAGR